MINVAALKAKINESGYRLRFLAEKLNLSYQGFFNKVNGISDFRTEEAGKLMALLRMTPEEAVRIFFDADVGNEPTNEEQER